MKMHPGWTAKDNYAINGKKKKKKRERGFDGGMLETSSFSIMNINHKSNVLL